MESIIITTKNKGQAQKLKKFAEKLGLKATSLEDKEDAALLKAMKEVEADKTTVSLSAFLRKLRSK